MPAPPDFLDMIKDDLGITDDANDAWLQRRLDGIWSAMENYTGRKLASPPEKYVDDWGQLVQTAAHKNLPPITAFQPRATVYLRVFPVVTIDAVTLNGQPADPAAAVADMASGKLFRLQGTGGPVDLGVFLPGSLARIEYTAGFTDLPADIYECVLGAITPQWAARQAQVSGMGGGGITSVNVVDVGSVELGNANSFVAAATKGGASAVDPILGPYASSLNSYVDLRSMLGSAAYPTTTPVPGP